MTHQSFFKEPRGSYVLDREKVKAERKQAEHQHIADAKKRDGYRCRWPEVHKCRFDLEGAHVFQHRGMGGDPSGERTDISLILTVCGWIHRRGPESIDGKQLKVEAETPDGTNGPLSFWKRDERGDYYCIGKERSIGVIDRD